MKKLTFILAIVLGILFAANTSSFAQSESGDIEAGVGLAYGTEVEQPGITADGYYTFNEQWRAGLGLTYFFPNDVGAGDINYFGINLNGNYIFHDEDGLMAYALAGINILSISYDYDSDFGSGSSSTSETGLNIGIGGEYTVDFGNLFAELKYAGLGGDADQLVISAGVRFPLN